MGGIPKYPQFPLRVDPLLIKKIRYIGKENCRSGGKEIELLIRNHVKQYEDTYGEITEDDLRNLDN